MSASDITIQIMVGVTRLTEALNRFGYICRRSIRWFSYPPAGTYARLNPKLLERVK